MSNICYFNIRAFGSKDNVKEFGTILGTMRSLENRDKPCLCGIETVTSTEEYDLSGDLYCEEYKGYCANDISSSTFKDDAFMQRCKPHFPKLTSIEEESERLSLEVYVAAYEADNDGREYFHFVNGKETPLDDGIVRKGSLPMTDHLKWPKDFVSPNEEPCYRVYVCQC